MTGWAVQPTLLGSSSARITTHTASKCAATRCGKNAEHSRRANARRISTLLDGEQDCRPFPRTPFPASEQLASASLRIVSLDEAEHFAHNQKASVATLRWCSASARNTVRLSFGIAFAFAGIRTNSISPCLLRMQFQSELREPLPKFCQEPLRI